MWLKIIIVLLVVTQPFLLFAQKNKPGFQSIVQGGILEGERGTSFQLQIINGIKYRTWSTGIGVGLDHYHTRSIPLFLDLRKTIFRETQTPFIYASAGYHFPWTRPKDALMWSNENAKGGIYYDAGIGYQFAFLKRNSLFFSAGYSYKKFSQEVAQYVYCFVGPCPEHKQTFEYQVRRLSIKTGLRF